MNHLHHTKPVRNSQVISLDLQAMITEKIGRTGIRETTGITEKTGKTEIIAKTATTETEIIIETIIEIIALIKIKSIEAIIKDKIKNIIRTAARITEIMGIMVPEKIGMITAKTAVSVKIIRNLPTTAEWV